MALKRASTIEGGKKTTRVSEKEVQNGRLDRTESVWLKALDRVPSNRFTEILQRTKTLIFIFNSVLFKYCAVLHQKIRRILEQCKNPKLLLKVSRSCAVILQNISARYFATGSFKLIISVVITKNTLNLR
jgi:hypothetical protein